LRYSSLYLSSLCYINHLFFIGKLDQSDEDDGKYVYVGFLPDEYVNYKFGQYQNFLYGLVMFANIAEFTCQIFENTSARDAKALISSLCKGNSKKKRVKFHPL